MAIETGSDADVQVSFTMGSRQAALRNASPPNIVAIHGFDSMLTSESVYSHIITLSHDFPRSIATAIKTVIE